MLVCLIIVMVVGKVCVLTALPFIASATIGAVVAIIVGVLKEVIDACTGGKFDNMDLLFDVVGALVGIILFSFMVI